LSSDDYYQILGIPKNASDSEIKKTYRKLAIQYHPDRNEGKKEAEEKFKEIAEAYGVLSDPSKRQLYDQFGKDGLRGAGFSTGFSSVEDIFSSFGSIFEDFFGFNTRPRQRQDRGSDLRYDLEITFREAVLGAQKEIQIPLQATCEPCQGSGSSPGTKKRVCPRCQGTGSQTLNQGFFMIATTCSVCHGKGEIIDSPCPTCRGSGLSEKEHKVSLTIPPGVDDGTRMRLNGEGERGSGNGPPGDLYVFLHVAEDERYERDGFDLHTRLHIDFVQAILGTEVSVPLLDGECTVTIKPGTQPGDTLVVRGAGVQHIRGRGQGDLLIHVQVDLPKKLTSEQEALLRQYAEQGNTKVSKKAKHFFSRR
jgi:molecular chaperone DnaJ